MEKLSIGRWFESGSKDLIFFLSSYSIISSFFFFFLSNTATEIHRMYFCVFVPEGEFFFVLLSRN